jgi:hypothetical protein
MSPRPLLHRLQTLLGVCAACVTAAAAGDLKPLKPITTGAGPGSSLVAPDMNALRSLAQSRGLSALERDLRLALFLEIDAMTREHSRALTNVAGRLTITLNAADWMAQRASGKGIPGPDRAIIAGLLLQTDLLEAALKRRNPELAGRLGEARNAKLIQKPGDRVFGDRRDHIFRFCMRELQLIADFQKALGVAEAGNTLSACTARTPDEAKACLLNGVTCLSERARRIP